METQYPFGSKIVCENILIGVTMTLAFILIVLCSVAVNSSGFLVLPLTIEWLRLVLATSYLLVRESRARGTQPDFQNAVMMFCGEFVLGIVSGVPVTIRSWEGSLCQDFVKIANPCSVSLLAVGLSLLTTTTAFAGVLLSCAGPLFRLYLRLRLPRRPKVKSNGHAIELTNMSTYREHDGGREQWTDIPV